MRKTTSGGPGAKVVAIGVLVCLVSAACSTAFSSAPPSAHASTLAGPTPSASGCLVGEAWNAYAQERIARWDQPAMEWQMHAAGADYDWADAKASAETQATQIDEFVARGAKVIVLRAAGDGETTAPPAILNAIDRAARAGVPVIDYDYLVDSPNVLAVAFDPVEIGRMEARAILTAKPKGNYAIIKGHPRGQAEPDLIASGIHEVLQPAIDRGDVKIVAETYIENWDPAVAQEQMKSILSANTNRIDAVIAESNGMAAGVIEALKEVGLEGKVAVAGQDDDDVWAFKGIAAGTQTVDVWTDLRLLGKAAGDAAVALCKNPDISKLNGTSQLSLPGGNRVTSILVKPQAITRDNLDVPIDAGWSKKIEVCMGIDPSAAPPVCR